MNRFNEVNEALDALNAATNEIAESVDQAAENDAELEAEIERLKAAVEAGGVVTPEEFDSVLNRLSSTRTSLQEQAERLRGLAADPENPVPEPAPAPEDPNA